MDRRGVFVTVLVVALVGVGPASATVGGVSNSVATGTTTDLAGSSTQADLANSGATKAAASDHGMPVNYTTSWRRTTRTRFV